MKIMKGGFVRGSSDRTLFINPEFKSKKEEKKNKKLKKEKK